jgi:hypothetical protein
MKIHYTFANTLFTLFTVVGVGCASAQSATDNTVSDQTVIALSQDGTQVKAPSHLQVAVHPFQAAVPKLLIGLKNEAGGYVTIKLKDSLGKNIHRPIFCYRKALVVTFDMGQEEAGSYIVEVANKSERYRYHIQVGSKVVPSVEVKPTVLAKVKQ